MVIHGVLAPGQNPAYRLSAHPRAQCHVVSDKYEASRLTVSDALLKEKIEENEGRLTPDSGDKRWRNLPQSKSA
tara:strand:- start:614 stop:835 length:222 start_codon:yes stop_codon:yes gene_type:complete